MSSPMAQGRSLRHTLQEAMTTYEEVAGTAQHRLWVAWTTGPYALGAKEFPADLQDRWRMLTELVNLESARGEEGTARATIDRMSDDEVNEVVDLLTQIRDDLFRRFPPSDDD